MPCEQHDPYTAQRLAQLRSLLEAESGDGLKLLKSLRNNPICSVYLTETVPCITVVWQRYATSAQFRYLHESMLLLLKKYAVNKILSDDTHIPIIHEDDQRWVIEDWMPRAVAAGLRATASKIPTPYFGRRAVENIRSRACNGVTMRCFDDLESARDWLRSLVFQ